MLVRKQTEFLGYDLISHVEKATSLDFVTFFDGQQIMMIMNRFSDKSAKGLHNAHPEHACAVHEFLHEVGAGWV